MSLSPRLYQRYDFQHRGLLNYKDFLYRLGINVEERNKPRLNNDSVPASKILNVLHASFKWASKTEMHFGGKKRIMTESKL